MFLGAMTGYDSTSTAWIDVEGTNNIVPTSYIERSWAIAGTWNTTFDQPVCTSTTAYYQQADYVRPRLTRCKFWKPYNWSRREDWRSQAPVKCITVRWLRQGHSTVSQSVASTDRVPAAHRVRQISCCMLISAKLHERSVWLSGEQRDISTVGVWSDILWSSNRQELQECHLQL